MELVLNMLFYISLKVYMHVIKGYQTSCVLTIELKEI
jgi:hypothetical protein